MIFRPRCRGLASAALLLLVTAVGAGEFRPALPGYRFSFPRDHASHDDFKTEWWYYVGHLAGPDGGAYGFQLTFFRSGIEGRGSNPSRWAARNLYMAHFALSDEGRRRLRYAERIGRGALGDAGASRDTYRVWIGDWEVRAEGEGHRLRARDGGFAIDLRVRPERAPAIHGRDGVSRKGTGSGEASHYYSLTRLRAGGTLILDGREVKVAGLSWMDHEFGSGQLGPEQVGWDWFGLQLDDGTDLMLYQIRREDGTADPQSSGTLITPEGKAVHLRREEFQVEVLDRWKSPRSGGVYPMRWRLAIPGVAMDLTLVPAFPDQELDTARSTRVIYWEGVVRAQGMAGGRGVTGKGYVEMTGYAERFRKKI